MPGWLPPDPLEDTIFRRAQQKARTRAGVATPEPGDPVYMDWEEREAWMQRVAAEREAEERAARDARYAPLPQPIDPRDYGLPDLEAMWERWGDVAEGPMSEEEAWRRGIELDAPSGRTAKQLGADVVREAVTTGGELMSVPFEMGLKAVEQVPVVGEPVAGAAHKVMALPFEATSAGAEAIMRRYPDVFDQSTPDGQANIKLVTSGADIFGLVAAHHALKGVKRVAADLPGAIQSSVEAPTAPRARVTTIARQMLPTIREQTLPEAFAPGERAELAERRDGLLRISRSDSEQDPALEAHAARISERIREPVPEQAPPDLPLMDPQGIIDRDLRERPGSEAVGPMPEPPPYQPTPSEAVRAQVARASPAEEAEWQALEAQANQPSPFGESMDLAKESAILPAVRQALEAKERVFSAPEPPMPVEPPAGPVAASEALGGVKPPGPVDPLSQELPKTNVFRKEDLVNREVKPLKFEELGAPEEPGASSEFRPDPNINLGRPGSGLTLNIGFWPKLTPGMKVVAERVIRRIADLAKSIEPLATEKMLDAANLYENVAAKAGPWGKAAGKRLLMLPENWDTVGKVANELDIQAQLAVDLARKKIKVPDPLQRSVGWIRDAEAQAVIPEVANLLRPARYKYIERMEGYLRALNATGWSKIRRKSRSDKVIYKWLDGNLRLPDGTIPGNIPDMVKAGMTQLEAEVAIAARIHLTRIFLELEKAGYAKPIQYRENYVPHLDHIYEYMQGQGDFLKQFAEGETNAVKNRFLLTRTGEGADVGSAIDSLEAWTRVASRQLEMSKAVKQASRIMTKYGKGQRLYGETYLNAVLDKPVHWEKKFQEWFGADATSIAARTALLGRVAFSRAVIGLSSPSAITNLVMGAVNIMAGPNFWKSLSTWWKTRKGISQKFAEAGVELRHKRPVRLGRRFLQVPDALVNAVDAIIYKPMDWTNNITSGVAYVQGVLEAGKVYSKAWYDLQLGYKGKPVPRKVEARFRASEAKALNQAGIDNALKVQNLGGVTEQAPIYSDPFIGTVLQFMRPLSVQANFMMRELGGKAFSGNFKPALRWLTAVGATVYLANKLGYDISDKFTDIFVAPTEFILGGSKHTSGGMLDLVPASQMIDAIFAKLIYHMLRERSVTHPEIFDDLMRVVGKAVPGGGQAAKIQRNLFPTQKQKERQMRMALGQEREQPALGERLGRTFLPGPTSQQSLEGELREDVADIETPALRQERLSEWWKRARAAGINQIMPEEEPPSRRKDENILDVLNRLDKPKLGQRGGGP